MPTLCSSRKNVLQFLWLQIRKLLPVVGGRSGRLSSDPRRAKQKSKVLSNNCLQTDGRTAGLALSSPTWARFRNRSPNCNKHMLADVCTILEDQNQLRNRFRRPCSHYPEATFVDDTTSKLSLHVCFRGKRALFRKPSLETTLYLATTVGPSGQNANQILP